MTVLGADALVDERTGIITWVRRVEPDPGSPPGLHIWASHTADVYRLFGWPADRYGTGMSFERAAHARMGAIGEAIERYCGNHVPADLLPASYEELVAVGRDAVDPATVLLYSDAQHADAGFPFVRFTRDLPVRWTGGHRIRDGASVLVPASLVWVNYFLAPRDSEPPTNFAVFAGIAAGVSERAAWTAAIEELIERDATMLWWHSGGEPIRIDVDDPALAATVAPPPGSPVQMHYVLVPNRYGVPVVGALLHDREDEYTTLGVAARPDAPSALAKAAAEAWSLRSYARGLDDPDGMIWQAAAADLIDGTPLKPHRPDRHYTASYRADFRDVVDLSCQAQIYLDPRMQHWCDRIRQPSRRTALSQIPPVRGEPLGAYLRTLDEFGIDPIAVDLTTPDVAACGLHVARVVAPGMYSNPPAAFPFLAGDRLLDEPVALGLATGRLDPGELVLAPLPHT
ncbi:MAG: YcaO-like family protein [Ilumatobacteraceae bacterium]